MRGTRYEGDFAARVADAGYCSTGSAFRPVLSGL